VELHESPSLTSWLSATSNVLGAVIGANLGIPIPLGDAAHWVAGRGEVIARRRTEFFLSSLSKRLDTIETQAIEPEFFDSEYWHDLFRKAFEEALKPRSNDKIEYYVRILKGAAVDSLRGDYSAEEYLYLISDLTIQEVRLARLLYESRPPNEEGAWKDWQEDACNRIGIDTRDLQLTLGRLYSSGLLQHIMAGSDEDGNYTQLPENADEIGYYVVTPAFEKLIDFLELE
jgi:hypothetical protein